MTKKFTGLLFFIIYSIVGIAVPAVQFSYAGHPLETNYQILQAKRTKTPSRNLNCLASKRSRSFATDTHFLSII